MLLSRTASGVPKSRVKLHVHLDGSLRPETIWELSKQKNVPLPGDGSLRDLCDSLICSSPKDLHHFLKGFGYIIPAIVVDLAAIERVAYEFCRDKAAQGVAYVEARYNPHIMLSTKNVNGCVDVPLNCREQEVYDKARRLGIHRTVHAGESGGADMVNSAVDMYCSERVGHGYHVLQDRAVYENCRQKDIHLETCPWSSLLTGSVPLHAKHPIVQFAEDGANFSLNTDDPTIMGKELGDDYNLVMTWGLTEAHLVQANMNAARSCFLPEDEKRQLLRKLKRVYGVDE